MTRRPARYLWSVALLAVSGTFTQQSATAQGSKRDAPPPCSAPEHRQFDFWLGEWEVRDSAGKLAGNNRITRVQQGCALLEEWKGSSGVTGMSLNAYDADRKRWHQTWVDSTGGLLIIEGAFKDGKMVLSGEAMSNDTPPKKTMQRITWEPRDGTVRQLWESSNDDGKTWTVAFDGRYTKASRP